MARPIQNFDAWHMHILSMNREVQADLGNFRRHMDVHDLIQKLPDEIGHKSGVKGSEDGGNKVLVERLNPPIE